jgi:hypothetical protein
MANRVTKNVAVVRMQVFEGQTYAVRFVNDRDGREAAKKAILAWLWDKAPGLDGGWARIMQGEVNKAAMKGGKQKW